MEEKIRIDVALVARNLASTRQKAKYEIDQGNVYVNDIQVKKSSKLVDNGDKIEIKGEKLKYVSRGGLKLEKAINEFEINLNNKECADIGASTGGFTDCMLQNGAKKVYAIDVGHGQLAESIKANSKVINLEGTNIKNLQVRKYNIDNVFGGNNVNELVVNNEDNDVNNDNKDYNNEEDEDNSERLKNRFAIDLVDFASSDVSFISELKVLPKIYEILKIKGRAVILVKPQFEAGEIYLNKNGVVKNIKVHKKVLSNIVLFSNKLGFKILGITYSPIKGPAGNIEYLLYLEKNSNNLLNNYEINSKINTIVDEAFKNLR